eukprot:4507124-Pyramimonas_sp.AAC.1
MITTQTRARLVAPTSYRQQCGLKFIAKSVDKVSTSGLRMWASGALTWALTWMLTGMAYCGERFGVEFGELHACEHGHEGGARRRDAEQAEAVRHVSGHILAELSGEEPHARLGRADRLEYGAQGAQCVRNVSTI